MPTVFINGKKVEMPNSVTADDIVRNSGRRNVDASTRAPIIVSTGGNTRMKPGQRYSVKDGSKFKVVPDRVKASGDFTYFGHKEPWRKQVIEQQVAHVAQKFFKNSKVTLDDDCNWVEFHSFLLPKEWQAANHGKKFVPMMLIFPDQYPDLPTNGFYLPDDLVCPTHFFNRGFGGAFGENDDEINAMAQTHWKWYCTHIKPGAWQPARLREISDWRYGDNLWDILTICIDVLTYPLDD